MPPLPVRRLSHRISRDSWKVVNQRDRLLSGQLFNEAGLTRRHANGMTRTRVSTTVNEELLASARRLRPGLTAVGREQGGHSKGPWIHSARGPVSDLWGAKLRYGSVLPELRLAVGPYRFRS
jgi:hypothetical protein